jgi:uncharacterized protein (DUF2062 family)
VLQRLYQRTLSLWRSALDEHATPGELARAIGLGAFVGCTPFLGFHLGIALALATAFRLNRAWTAIGSRVSFFLALPWIVLAEVQVAHRFRTGHWAPFLPHDALDHAHQYVLDWWLGSVPVGCACGLALGAMAYVVARRRERVTRRTPSRSPRPSSESRP